MHLKPGETYLYKYVINNQHWVVNDEEPQRKDNSGNVNNLCIVDDANLSMAADGSSGSFAETIKII